MKGAKPRHAFGDRPSKRFDPLLHFRAALLVKVTARISRAGAARQDMRDLWSERGSSGARAGEHEKRAVDRPIASRCSAFSPSK
jgi:hypothetical protein